MGRKRKEIHRRCATCGASYVHATRLTCSVQCQKRRKQKYTNQWMRDNRREWMRRREAERYRTQTEEKREKHNARNRERYRKMRAAYIAVKDIMPEIATEDAFRPTEGQSKIEIARGRQRMKYGKLRAAYLAVKDIIGE